MWSGVWVELWMLWSEQLSSLIYYVHTLLWDAFRASYGFLVFSSLTTAQEIELLKYVYWRCSFGTKSAVELIHEDIKDSY